MSLVKTNQSFCDINLTEFILIEMIDNTNWCGNINLRKYWNIKKFFFVGILPNNKIEFFFIIQNKNLDIFG
jgi:hypothetical protein